MHLPFSYPVETGLARRPVPPDQREREQDDDDGPVHDVVPTLVDVIAQQFLIVEQQLQKDDGRRQHDAGEDLHAEDDQL